MYTPATEAVSAFISSLCLLPKRTFVGSALGAPSICGVCWLPQQHPWAADDLFPPARPLFNTLRFTPVYPPPTPLAHTTRTHMCVLVALSLVYFTTKLLIFLHSVNVNL